MGAFSLNKPKIKTSMKKFTNNSIILTGIKKCGKNREESIFKMKTFMKKSAKNSIILKLWIYENGGANVKWELKNAKRKIY